MVWWYRFLGTCEAAKACCSKAASVSAFEKRSSSSSNGSEDAILLHMSSHPLDELQNDLLSGLSHDGEGSSKTITASTL